jgi:NADH:ubiquinone oxidoreductase subunit 6 (subunit J)
MAFMLLILAFLIVATVWALFHTNPQGVNARALLIYNIVVLTLAVPVAICVGVWLYADAVAVKANEKGMATYLTIMAAGTSAMLVVAVGGFIRNFVAFPRHKRRAAPPDGT